MRSRRRERRRATAESIRATFVLDVSLIRSFGRETKEGDKKTQLGLSDRRQEFLVALALWKIQKLLASPFRFRSGCHLRRMTLKSYDQDVEIDVDIKAAIKGAGLDKLPVTDVFWPREELYREGRAEDSESTDDGEEEATDDNE